MRKTHKLDCGKLASRGLHGVFPECRLRAPLGTPKTPSWDCFPKRHLSHFRDSRNPLAWGCFANQARVPKSARTGRKTHPVRRGFFLTKTLAQSARNSAPSGLERAPQAVSVSCVSQVSSNACQTFCLEPVQIMPPPSRSRTPCKWRRRRAQMSSFIKLSWGLMFLWPCRHSAVQLAAPRAVQVTSFAWCACPGLSAACKAPESVGKVRRWGRVARPSLRLLCGSPGAIFAPMLPPLLAKLCLLISHVVFDSRRSAAGRLGNKSEVGNFSGRAAGCFDPF